MEFYFKEEQKFTQWWLWLILVSVAGVPLIQGIKHFLNNGKYEDDHLSTAELIGASIFVICLFGLFLIMKLKTVIDDKKVYIQYIPFLTKDVKWSEIKNAKVVNYGFVGGWGLRFGTNYGTIYNVKGNKGLAIELHNGDRFLIGTQRSDELEALVIRKMKSENQFKTKKFQE